MLHEPRNRTAPRSTALKGLSSICDTYYMASDKANNTATQHGHAHPGSLAAATSSCPFWRWRSRDDRSPGRWLGAIPNGQFDQPSSVAKSQMSRKHTQKFQCAVQKNLLSRCSDSQHLCQYMLFRNRQVPLVKLFKELVSRDNGTFFRKYDFL